ncbi:MAG: methylated-DNA--[protein]-cysteine S-methyltransferase [Gammaproteobacteria bacterium]|nr:methylated-DNA--[protein]-cysteine S-methyltransferase [Gammaproteobacteria bacterium]
MAAPVAETTYAAILPAPADLRVKLGVRLHSSALVSIDFLPSHHADLTPATALALRVTEQLRRYFTDPRHVFSVPLALQGTPFQQKVWRALMRIPPGATLSYGALAAQLTTGARAVGNACRANPVPIIVPCHRVVARDGMGGYAGAATGRNLQLKRWLLSHEQRGG